MAFSWELGGMGRIWAVAAWKIMVSKSNSKAISQTVAAGMGHNMLSYVPMLSKLHPAKSLFGYGERSLKTQSLGACSIYGRIGRYFKLQRQEWVSVKVEQRV
eukprot:SAG31_NODE_2048_length_6565_cov_2.692700_4_plen_102_part_00